jgi:hypothetical protein
MIVRCGGNQLTQVKIEIWNNLENHLEFLV